MKIGIGNRGKGQVGKATAECEIRHRLQVVRGLRYEMQRIAVRMIGGMISSTILTLVVIPAVYGVIKGWGLPAVPLHRTPDRCVEEARTVAGQVS